MDDTGHTALHFDFDRHDIAPFTLRKILFLQELSIAPRVQDLVELMADLLLQLVRMMSESAQFRCG